MNRRMIRSANSWLKNFSEKEKEAIFHIFNEKKNFYKKLKEKNIILTPMQTTLFNSIVYALSVLGLNYHDTYTIILSSEGGDGKSFLLNLLKEHFKIKLSATSHVAAANFQGTSWHQLTNNYQFYDPQKFEALKYSTVTFGEYLDVQFVPIDEAFAGMNQLDMNRFYATFDHWKKTYSRNGHSTLKHLFILTGDAYQASAFVKSEDTETDFKSDMELFQDLVLEEKERISLFFSERLMEEYLKHAVTIIDTESASDNPRFLDKEDANIISMLRNPPKESVSYICDYINKKTSLCDVSKLKSEDEIISTLIDFKKRGGCIIVDYNREKQTIQKIFEEYNKSQNIKTYTFRPVILEGSPQLSSEYKEGITVAEGDHIFILGGYDDIPADAAAVFLGKSHKKEHIRISYNDRTYHMPMQTFNDEPQDGYLRGKYKRYAIRNLDVLTVRLVQGRTLPYPMPIWYITRNESNGLFHMIISGGKTTPLDLSFKSNRVYVVLSRAQRLSQFTLSAPIRESDILSINDNIVGIELFDTVYSVCDISKVDERGKRKFKEQTLHEYDLSITSPQHLGVATECSLGQYDYLIPTDSIYDFKHTPYEYIGTMINGKMKYFDWFNKQSGQFEEIKYIDDVKNLSNLPEHIEAQYGNGDIFDPSALTVRVFAHPVKHVALKRFVFETFNGNIEKLKIINANNNYDL